MLPSDPGNALSAGQQTTWLQVTESPRDILTTWIRATSVVMLGRFYLKGQAWRLILFCWKQFPAKHQWFVLFIQHDQFSTVSESVHRIICCSSRASSVHWSRARSAGWSFFWLIPDVLTNIKLVYYIILELQAGRLTHKQAWLRETITLVCSEWYKYFIGMMTHDCGLWSVNSCEKQSHCGRRWPNVTCETL